MMALVKCEETKQTRGAADGSCGTFPTPKDGRRIVAVGFDGALADIMRLRYGFEMQYGPHEFQLTIVNVSLRVVP